ncbi:MAG TPA: DUF2167 domain-containing protein [Polyangia bacterium]|jgi:uncharacterized membrane-anchored protein|nr:DUF2167 domain-containing protein [Polyangia bacterium]
MAHVTRIPLLCGLAAACSISWGLSVAWADNPTPPAAPAEQAAAAENDPFAKIKFQNGPLTGKLGNLATIQIPEGYLFVEGKAESAKFVEATQNFPTHRELGVLVPLNGGKWWLLFEFDDVGYVKDDEKDKLDADAILNSMKEATNAGNEERRKRGWGELQVTGWYQAPRYNNETHNLEWAARVHGKDGDSINYEIRLLGRRGVMSAQLIGSPEETDKAVPELRKLLTGFTYLKEESYAAYRSGDKVAEYGLTALIAGGTLAVAAKSGLLGKLWKLIVAGFVALAGAVKRLFGGRKKEEQGQA